MGEVSIDRWGVMGKGREERVGELGAFAGV